MAVDVVVVVKVGVARRRNDIQRPVAHDAVLGVAAAFH
jgi:hypothetical protein